jgi:hypothetical protein
MTTEDLIRTRSSRFRAPVKTKFICGPGFAGHVRIDSEKVLHLPGGKTMKVTTDASGTVSHVEEDHSLHAIVRPDTHKGRLRR